MPTRQGPLAASRLSSQVFISVHTSPRHIFLKASSWRGIPSASRCRMIPSVSLQGLLRPKADNSKVEPIRPIRTRLERMLRLGRVQKSEIRWPSCGCSLLQCSYNSSPFKKRPKRDVAPLLRQKRGSNIMNVVTLKIGRLGNIWWAWWTSLQ